MGFAFVSISVSAMSDLGEDQAGLAAGLITTAHDLGAAAGVSIFSAVAFGSGAAGSARLLTGYGHGTAAGAAIAGALALVAVIAIPRLRPAATRRVALH